MKIWTTMCILTAMWSVCGAVYEAENFADTKNARIIANSVASGGKCVELLGNKTNDPDEAAIAVQWKFMVAQKGVYDLCIRVFVHSVACNSMFVALDGEEGQPAFFFRYGQWVEWERNRVVLSPGEHTLTLKTRRPGLLVDNLEITVAERYSRTALNRFPAPPVYPVRGEHPRVLLRKQDLAVIRTRLEHPENAKIWKNVKKMADTPTIEKLDPVKHKIPYGIYSEKILRVIEAKAFVWLMEGNHAAGESAVKSILGVLSSTQFQGTQDVTRPIGETIFTAGLVYDWCYPLITPEQRKQIIDCAEKLCSQMEVGFPPIRQGNVTGHAGEAQINRDLLCYGIAVYDECPEMYRIVAGRLFSEIAEARRFFHPAGRHHQGNAYGPYRFQWEIYSAWVIRRMCGIELYDCVAANMVYDWLYNRTPDGAILQVGDNYLQDHSFMCFQHSTFYLYTWARSPMAKAEFLFQNGMNMARSNPVIYLLLNEPDVKSATPDELAALPLTHYFPMPSPAMTARSGWGFGKASDLVVVEMIGAGYQFNNHHHLDAGSFQIYHRGLLAADLGQYKTYGTDYDMNFNKQSIAHNLLLVRNPRVKNSNIVWRRRPTAETFDFVGGQVWPNNGLEANNLDTVFKKGYRTGSTVAHAFGPDTKLPLYSHLKCDLSHAYGARVKRYFRSFVYVNTNDPEIPAVLTIFDHATAADPEFEKIWIMNTYLKPVIAGNSVTAIWNQMGYNGQMKAVSLLPENAVIETVPALTVCGKTFTPPKTKLPSANAFRTEIRPREKASIDTFLTVIGVGKAGDPLSFKAKTIPGKTVVGAAFKNHAVYFSANAQLLTNAFDLTVPEGKDVRVVVTDLAPGTWEVLMAGDVIARRKIPAADGTLFFIMPQGGTAKISPAESAGQDIDYSVQKAVPATGDCGIFLDGKNVLDDPPRVIYSQLFVPVRPLAGSAFRARKDGFNLDRGDVSLCFTAGVPYILSGKYRFFVGAKPKFIDGEWMYPAGTLAIILNKHFSVGLRNNSVYFRTILPESGVVPIVAAYCPSIYGSPLSQLFDGNLATYWAGNKEQGVVTLFLGKEKTVDGVKLQWYNGKKRIYKFEILTSTDGKKFSEVWKGQSEKSGDWETIKFPPVRAAFVRLIGHGSQVGGWTSICELQLLAPK